MTIVCYKVGDTFTKSYSEAVKLSNSSNNYIIKFYYERTDIDDLDKIQEFTLEDLKKLYNNREVKSC